MVDYTSANHAPVSDPRLEHFLLRYPQNRGSGSLLHASPVAPRQNTRIFTCPSPVAHRNIARTVDFCMYDEMFPSGRKNGWRCGPAVIHCESVERHPPIPPKQQIWTFSSLGAPPKSAVTEDFVWQRLRESCGRVNGIFMAIHCQSVERHLQYHQNNELGLPRPCRTTKYHSHTRVYMMKKVPRAW